MLKVAETLAMRHGKLQLTDDYAVLASDTFRQFFSQYSRYLCICHAGWGRRPRWGLAVRQPSGLVCQTMRPLLDGCFTMRWVVKN